MPKPQDARDILTADEASALLRISRKTLYIAVRNGSIPHRKVGRRILFFRPALESWLRGENQQAAG